QIAKLHCFLGYAYESIHNEVMCMRNILEAVSIVENDCDDELLMGEVYLHTAIIYLNQSDYTKADGYISGAMSIFNLQRDSQAKLYRNFYNTALIVAADIKRATEQRDTAIQLYKKGIEGFEKTMTDFSTQNSARNSLKYLSDGHNGLGIAYQLNGDDKAAIYNMMIALKIRKSFAMQDKMADSYITIGEYYEHKKMPDSAYYYNVEGFNIAQDLRNHRLMGRAARNLAKHFAKKQDYKRAYKYTNIANDAYFLFTDTKQTKDVAREEMEYMFEAERQKAEDLKRQQEKTIEQDQKIINWAIAFVAMSVASLSVIAILFIKKKKKNQLLREQRDALEERSQELLVQQEEISQKNQELSATTEMLEESNKELRILSTVAAATVNAIFITDINGNFTWFNESFSKYSGIPFEELFTNPALKSFLMPQAAKDAYAKVLRTKKSADFLMNMKLFAPDKGDVWMQTTVTPVFDQNNEISMMVLVCSDITELRETTKKLEHSNRELKMLSAVASMTSNSIFITNYEGDIIWFNDAFTRNTGITLDEIRSNPILASSAMPLATKRAYEKVIRTKQPEEYTTQITHVEGMGIWVQVAVTPILDEDDDISMIVWVNTNITELHNVTQILEERNKELQMLSAVAANTGNSIYITTKEGKMIWFNNAFSRETHIPIEEIDTHPALKASAMTPETRATYEKVVATKQTQAYTAEMGHLGGKPFWVQAYVTPILDDNGEIIMIIWVSTDITKLHHAYEKIDFQNKEINESIAYARRIQDAVQPMKIFSDEILGDHFIINMPRNIVSGDFHWVGYKNGLSVFTVADCTGHGVPGAFISMLGQVMLTQTLNQLTQITAANILNMLRKSIIMQLHQRDKFGTLSDSMDASMFVYDREHCIIDYAGAFSHAYILRFGTPDAETEATCEASGSKIVVNDEGNAYLIRLKPNRMTIGIDRRDTIPFTGIQFKVNHGDIAYATTDGYPDQFGGEKQKRFYVANFEKLLLQCCHLPMEEQRKTLEKTYLDWKGDYEQTDDVHVLGIVL
ncbi:MAG: PAS domain-containing protein, partial [Bacteroidales bacterium]|nr:PAS domain-containing protein [Bacteroidales bacterium]